MKTSGCGYYLVIEGADSTGKSTISKEVERKLSELGHTTCLSHHPGSTAIGQTIRQVTKSDLSLEPLAIQLLMMADQVEFISKQLKPQLETNKTVIADRIHYISAIAYGLAEGLSIHHISRIIKTVVSPSPDLVVILDAPDDVLAQRRSLRHIDRFETDTKQASVINTYREIRNGAHSKIIASFVSPGRIRYLSNTGTVEEATNKILNWVEEQKNDDQQATIDIAP